MLKCILLVTIVTVAVQGLSQELKEKFLERLEKFGGECATEVGATEDDIAELISHKFPSRHEGECMIFCLYKRFDMMFPSMNNSLIKIQAIETLTTDTKAQQNFRFSYMVHTEKNSSIPTLSFRNLLSVSREKMHDDGSIHEEGTLKAMEPLKADDPELYEKFMSIGKHCYETVKKSDDLCKYSTELAQCGVAKGREMGLDESLFE